MRLHNRLIKAAFWTDEQVTAWPLAKRLFYVGLIQLADDSGCLEQSPRMIKRLLFPEEMTTDEVAALLAELVRTGQLIPYEADGKPCLYIRHFHDHQSLDSPARPEVPLPSWIRYEPYQSNRRQGRYIVDEAALSEYLSHKEDAPDDPLHFPYSSLTPALQNPSNQNQNLEPEPEKESSLQASPATTSRSRSRAKIFAEDSPEYGLASLLRERILQNNPHAKVPRASPDHLAPWCREIDLMLRVDGRAPPEIDQVIRWCQADPFWRANILSPRKLREKFDTLWLQMQRNGEVKRERGTDSDPRRAELKQIYANAARIAVAVPEVRPT